jgi:hypothetical protein
MRIASAYTLSREGLPTGLLRSVLQLPDADRVNNRYMKASMGEFSLGPKIFLRFFVPRLRGVGRRRDFIFIF